MGLGFSVDAPGGVEQQGGNRREQIGETVSPRKKKRHGKKTIELGKKGGVNDCFPK